ncbi:unnamed protein product, partial [marine sediment metagenome]
KELNCVVWDINNCVFQFDDVFGKRSELYRVRFQIQDIKIIENLLKTSKRECLLFDIVHDVPNMSENKVNYHSIAIYDKDWKDFSFIHATDFHIARRNDFIFNYLKQNVKAKVKNCGGNEKKISKINKFILTRDFELKEEFQDDRYEELRTAKYNFNYNLRKLINFANDKVSQKSLDFVLMTGDIIDYLNIARGNY